LKTASKLDWLKTKLTGKERLLTKHIVKSLSNNKHYSNTKIVKTLNYNFKPINQTIVDVAAIYLK